MASSRPVLYSFRRCPYAMRARMALRYSGIQVELREVVLREMPTSLLEASPKGTVPVLVMADGQVIDESRDIMHWALAQHDPDGWWPLDATAARADIDALIDANDDGFKPDLDRYKYAVRHPEQPPEVYRTVGERFLAQLEARLASGRWLLGERLSLADVALFPFVRQFAHVDKAWFDATPYPHLQAWLAVLLASDLFLGVMAKYPQWQPGDPVQLFPENAAIR